jgi:hypothetical protein
VLKLILNPKATKTKHLAQDLYCLFWSLVNTNLPYCSLKSEIIIKFDSDLILHELGKVRIFWEGHNLFFKSPNSIWRCLVNSKKVWEMFFVPTQNFWTLLYLVKIKFIQSKAELLQLNRTQFPSLGIFVSKKVGNRKN